MGISLNMNLCLNQKYIFYFQNKKVVIIKTHTFIMNTSSTQYASRVFPNLYIEMLFVILNCIKKFFRKCDGNFKNSSYANVISNSPGLLYIN